jgi:hypothetical protein
LADIGYNVDKDEIKTPQNTTLLYQLWPAIKKEIERRLSNWTPQQSEDIAEQDAVAKLNRISMAKPIIQPQPLIDTAYWAEILASEEPTGEATNFETLATITGTLVHEYLQVISEEGINNWSAQRVDRLRELLPARLNAEGLSEEEIEQAVETIIVALQNTLSDEKGRWILSDHEQAKSEYALTVKNGARFSTHIIDRTFVDEKGIRWIVDYKTVLDKSIDNEHLIKEQKEKYRKQLMQYASIMQKLDKREVRCALYLPLQKVFLSY